MTSLAQQILYAQETKNNLIFLAQIIFFVT